MTTIVHLKKKYRSEGSNKPAYRSVKMKTNGRNFCGVCGGICPKGRRKRFIHSGCRLYRRDGIKQVRPRSFTRA